MSDVTSAEAAKEELHPQEPLIRVPDSPEFAGHDAELDAALLLMDDAGPPDEEPKEVEAKTEEVEPEPEEKVEVKAKVEEVIEEEPKKGAAKAWAEVTAAEKKLRESRLEMKAEKHAFEQRLQAMEASAGQNTNLEAAIRQDPIAALQKLGISSDDFIQRALTGDGPTPVQPAVDPEKVELIERITKLEQHITASDQRSTYNGYMENVRDLLAEPQNAVLETLPKVESEIETLVTGHFQKYGTKLSEAEAVDILRDEWVSHLAQIGSHKAARQHLGLSEIEAVEQDSPAPGKTRKTLTNKQATQVSAKGKEELPIDLTHEQEIAEAAKLLDSSFNME